MAEPVGSPTNAGAPNPSDASTAPSADPTELFRQHKHRVKVDGQDLELSYDDLVTDYQHRKASAKRFQEAASVRKQVDEFVSSIQQGDLRPLIDTLGYDQFIDIANRALQEHQHYSELTPEQQDYLKTKYERDQLKKQYDDMLAAEKDRQAQSETEKALGDIDTEVFQVLSEMGRPATPRLIYNIAGKMIAALDNEDAPISAKDALHRTMKDMQEDALEYVSTLDTPALLKFLPPKVIEAIRTSGAEEIYSRNPLYRTQTEQSDKKYPPKTRRQASSERSNWHQDRSKFFKGARAK